MRCNANQSGIKASLGIIILLLACLTTDPAFAHVSMRSTAPERVDAFTGLLNRQTLIAGSGGPISRPHDLNVAVVLSENTKQQLAWSNDMMAGLRGFDRAIGGFIAGAKAVAEADRMLQLAYDPKFITDSVIQPLVSRFGRLKIVSGMTEFSQGHYDLVIILDVSFVNTFHDSWVFIGNKYETGTTVNTYLIDRRNVLIGQVEISLKQAVPREAFEKGVADLRTQVLSEYQTALSGLLGPPRSVFAAGAPRPSPVQTIAERLSALEELRKNGLITPQEAAQKRADILKGM